MLGTEKEYFCLLQSTLDISKLKFISDSLYFKVSYLIQDNLLRDTSSLRYKELE